MGCLNSKDSASLSDIRERHMSTHPAVPAAATMAKIRSRSDASLESLIKEPTVRTAFLKFMRLEFTEELLEFWLATEDFEVAKEHSKKMAQHIYDTFLKDRKILNLDSATLEQIENTIEKARTKVDSRVFQLAAEKCFQKMKFNHFPRFLLSKEFTNLTKKFDPEDHEYNESVSSSGGSMVSIKNETEKHIQTMELRFCLNRPSGREEFRNYVCSQTKYIPESNILDFWIELEDYRRTKNNDYRKKRAKLIAHRFLDKGSPCEVTKIDKDIKNDCLEKVKVVDSMKDGQVLKNIFLAGQNSSLHALERTFKEFKETLGYKRFMETIDQEDGIHSTIHDLESFKEDRKLQDTQVKQKELLNLSNFENLLESNQAMSFFQRFLRLEFSEESILFYKEVNEYKTGNLLTPKYGSMIFKTKDMSDKDVQTARAAKIVEKYIKVDSRFQVNIDDKERSRIIDRVEKELVTFDIFDAALTSVITFLKLDKFERFKKHKLFRLYQHCAFKRFSMRFFSYFFFNNLSQLLITFTLEISKLIESVAYVVRIIKYHRRRQNIFLSVLYLCLPTNQSHDFC